MPKNTITIKFTGSQEFQEQVFRKLKEEKPVDFNLESESLTEIENPDAVGISDWRMFSAPSIFINNKLIFSDGFQTTEIICINDFNHSLRADIVIGEAPSPELVAKLSKENTVYHFFSLEKNIWQSLIPQLVRVNDEKKAFLDEKGKVFLSHKLSTSNIKIYQEMIDQGLNFTQVAEKELPRLQAEAYRLQQHKNIYSKKLTEFYHTIPEAIKGIESAEIKRYVSGVMDEIVQRAKTIIEENKAQKAFINAMLKDIVAYPENIPLQPIYLHDNNGQTVFDYALKEEYEETVFLLLGYDRNKIFDREKAKEILEVYIKNEILHALKRCFQAFINGDNPSLEKKELFVKFVQTENSFDSSWQMLRSFNNALCKKINHGFNLGFISRDIFESALQTAMKEFIGDYLKKQKMIYSSDKEINGFINLLLALPEVSLANNSQSINRLIGRDSPLAPPQVAPKPEEPTILDELISRIGEPYKYGAMPF